MAERTHYQEKAIQRYYDNRGAIALQRVQELITELYLSEGKKRQTYWKTIRTHLAALKIPEKQIDHLVSQDKPELVAKLVQTLMEKQD